MYDTLYIYLVNYYINGQFTASLRGLLITGIILPHGIVTDGEESGILFATKIQDI